MRKQREGENVMNFEGHEDGINCMAVSSDDSLLVSLTTDCLWSTKWIIWCLVSIDAENMIKATA